MKKILVNFLLAAGLPLVAAMPSMAGNSSITIKAEIVDFLAVQLINSADNTIVSGDNSDAATGEVLNLGQIDARGISSGELAATKSTAGVSIKKVLVDNSLKVYQVTEHPANVAGALYYIEGSANTGYSVITNRDSGEVTQLTVMATGNIRALADKAGNFSGSVTAVKPDSIQPASGNPVLLGSLENNTPLPVTVGLFVENATIPGSRTAVITFTGA